MDRQWTVPGLGGLSELAQREWTIPGRGGIMELIDPEQGAGIGRAGTAKGPGVSLRAGVGGFGVVREFRE